MAWHKLKLPGSYVTLHDYVVGARLPFCFSGMSGTFLEQTQSWEDPLCTGKLSPLIPGTWRHWCLYSLVIHQKSLSQLQDADQDQQLHRPFSFHSSSQQWNFFWISSPMLISSSLCIWVFFARFYLTYSHNWSWINIDDSAAAHVFILCHIHGVSLYAVYYSSVPTMH